MTTLFAFFGMPGHLEALILLVVILLLFGHRLPGMMRSMGRSVVEFKKGVHEGEDASSDEEPSAKPAKVGEAETE